EGDDVHLAARAGRRPHGTPQSRGVVRLSLEAEIPEVAGVEDLQLELAVEDREVPVEGEDVQRVDDLDDGLLSPLELPAIPPTIEPCGPRGVALEQEPDVPLRFVDGRRVSALETSELLPILRREG